MGEVKSWLWDNQAKFHEDGSPKENASGTETIYGIKQQNNKTNLEVARHTCLYL